MGAARITFRRFQGGVFVSTLLLIPYNIILIINVICHYTYQLSSDIQFKSRFHSLKRSNINLIKNLLLLILYTERGEGGGFCKYTPLHRAVGAHAFPSSIIKYRSKISMNEITVFLYSLQRIYFKFYIKFELENILFN